MNVSVLDPRVDFHILLSELNAEDKLAAMAGKMEGRLVDEEDLVGSLHEKGMVGRAHIISLSGDL